MRETGGKNMDNRGISLIELLVGITVMAIVGLMAGSFLGMSTRMGRKTIAYADIQQESQSVIKRLTDGVLNGKNIYVQEDDDGLVLFFGEQQTGTNESATAVVTYQGETFFFDKENHSIYQMFQGIFSVETGEEGKTGVLNSQAVRGTLAKPEYRLSDCLTDMKVKLEIGGEVQEGVHGFLTLEDVKSVGLEFQLEFSRDGEEPYSGSSGATTRNVPQTVWFDTE